MEFGDGHPSPNVIFGMVDLATNITAAIDLNETQGRVK
jgi:hypothetical protein